MHSATSTVRFEDLVLFDICSWAGGQQLERQCSCSPVHNPVETACEDTTPKQCLMELQGVYWSYPL